MDFKVTFGCSFLNQNFCEKCQEKCQNSVRTQPKAEFLHAVFVPVFEPKAKERYRIIIFLCFVSMCWEKLNQKLHVWFLLKRESHLLASTFISSSISLSWLGQYTFCSDTCPCMKNLVWSWCDFTDNPQCKTYILYIHKYLCPK